MTKKITTTALLHLSLIFPMVHAQQTRPKFPEGTVVRRDLSYVDEGHGRQKLDLYLPADAKNLPLIVWIHGGAWMVGSKDAFIGALPFLAEGFAVASINYRLSQHAIFPAQIEDCKAAIRWLRAHAGEYGFDPARIGVWGPSAGGHLSALVGTAGDVKEFDVGANLANSSAVQAVVDFFGPTDFLQMDGNRILNGMMHDTPDSPESKLVGGLIRDHKAQVQQANPITYVTKNDPPFLIVHGDSDPLVPHHQSVLLHAALLETGVPVEFYTVKGGGHGAFEDPKVPELVSAFFKKHLKKQNLN